MAAVYSYTLMEESVALPAEHAPPRWEILKSIAVEAECVWRFSPRPLVFDSEFDNHSASLGAGDSTSADGVWEISASESAFGLVPPDVTSPGGSNDAGPASSPGPGGKRRGTALREAGGRHEFSDITPF